MFSLHPEHPHREKKSRVCAGSSLGCSCEATAAKESCHWPSLPSLSGQRCPCKQLCAHPACLPLAERRGKLQNSGVKPTCPTPLCDLPWGSGGHLPQRPKILCRVAEGPQGQRMRDGDMTGTEDIGWGQARRWGKQIFQDRDLVGVEVEACRAGAWRSQGMQRGSTAGRWHAGWGQGRDRGRGMVTW